MNIFTNMCYCQRDLTIVYMKMYSRTPQSNYSSKTAILENSLTDCFFVRLPHDADFLYAKQVLGIFRGIRLYPVLIRM